MLAVSTFLKRSLYLGLTLAFTVGCNKCSKDNASQTSSSNSNESLLELHRSSDPRSLDPQRQFDSASGEIVHNVYDTLLEYDYLQRPYQLKPNLLEKMPETLDPDKKVYQFTLRKGVMFIDDACFAGGKGRELNADDVIYTLKRFADANINTNSYFLLKNMVVGMDEFNQLTTKTPPQQIDHKTAAISGIEKVDNYTLKVTLKVSNPLFLYAFATQALGIVPHEAVSKYGNDFQWHPVGTGPFILREFQKNQTLTFTKNPNYHGVYPDTANEQDKQLGLAEAAGKKVPQVDKIIYNFIPESQPQMLKFLRGELDVIGFDRDNFVKMAEKTADGRFILKPEYAKKFEIYTEPRLAVDFLTFNMKDPLIGKNKDLRLAIAHAMNVEKYIEVLWNGRGNKLNSLVPLNIAGNDRDLNFTLFPYDLAKAKELLAKAGYPEGKGLPEITIDYRSTSTIAQRSFEMVRSDLAAVGINVKGNFQTFAAFLKNMDSSNFQIAEAGWNADYPDAENFFQLLYGPNKAPGSNNSNFDNAKYNEIYEKIRFMADSPERMDMFRQLNEILKEEAPVIPMANLITVGMRQKWLKSFKRDVLSGEPFSRASFYSSDSKLKEQMKNAELRN